MQPTEYTLPDEARAELIAAAKANNERFIFDNDIIYNDNTAQHPAHDAIVRLNSRIDLMHILNCSPEGSAILEALEHIRHSAYSPLIVIHNLPAAELNNEERCALLEMFRQYIYNEASPAFKESVFDGIVYDKPTFWKATGYEREGAITPHTDEEDVTLNFMVNPGANPRPTLFWSAEELAEQITEHLPAKLHADSTSVLTLLSKPMWRYEDERENRSENFTEKPNGKKPIVRPICPSYLGEDSKTAYHMAPIAAGQRHTKILNKNADAYKALSKEQKTLAQEINIILREILMYPNHDHGAYFCDEGDLVIFDNSRMLHAGGMFKYSNILDASFDGTEKERYDTPRYIDGADTEATQIIAPPENYVSLKELAEHRRAERLVGEEKTAEAPVCARF